MVNEKWVARTLDGLHYYGTLSEAEQLELAGFITQLEGAEVAGLVAMALSNGGNNDERN